MVAKHENSVGFYKFYHFDKVGHLRLTGNYEGASNSLKRLYGDAESTIFEEIDKIEMSLKESTSRKAKLIDLELFKNRVNVKVIFLTCALMGMQHLSGYSVFLSFLVAIFEEARSTVGSISASTAAIIVGTVQVVACCSMTLVIDKVRRKAFLIASLLIIITSLVVLGTYMKLSVDGVDLTAVGFIPLICLMCYMWSFNFGLSALSWVFLIELSAPDVRSTCAVLSSSMAFLMSFVIVFSFSALADAVGAHGAYWTCAGFASLLLAIAIFEIPETRGKTIEEVQEALRK